MNKDFSDSTIMIPNESSATDRRSNKAGYQTNVDINPILGNFIPLLCYVVGLKEHSHYEKHNELFTQCANQIKTSTESLRASYLDDNTIVTARYIICGFIDEVILNTPWGVDSQWSSQCLLSYFHKEINAGEKFFSITNTLLGHPQQYSELLELVYTLLALGYMGKYRFQDNGKSILAEIKSQLLRAIKPLRENTRQRLSHIQLENKRPVVQAFSDQRSIFITLGVCFLLCLGVFMTLLFKLNSTSDAILNESLLLTKNLEIPIKNRPKRTVVSQQADWKQYIHQDVVDNKLNFIETANEIRFIIQGNNLFSSGKAVINNPTIFHNIAKAIAMIEGKIVVSGHTDNIPIRSLQYPSNWALSQARASAVTEFIQPLLNGRTIRTEGMGDTQPLVDNNTAEQRMLNRRVEISIYTD